VDHRSRGLLKRISTNADKGCVAGFSDEGEPVLRTTLGKALEECAEEVADGVRARLQETGLSEEEAADRTLLRAISRADIEATRVMGRWVATGEGASREEMSRLGALGMLVDERSLACLVRAYLAWRDVILVILEREATTVGAGEKLTTEVRRMIGRSADVSLVQMARRVDRERKRLQVRLAAEQKKLAHLAHYDSLTGLANRRQLAHCLDQALQATGPDAVTVCFMDLDGFKAVNDAHGHEVGDRLLRALGSRLRADLRPTDTAARVGGDEFVVICPNLGDDSLEVVALAKRLLARASQAYQINGHEVRVTASVGICVGNAADNSEELLTRADAAMYTAKEGGGSRFQLYKPGAGRAISRDAQLSQDLRRAIEHEELSIAYQPIASLNGSKTISSTDIRSVEALARWRHPQHGSISPMEFIPLAERTGLVRAIDDLVLRGACRQAKRWRDQGWPIGVAVNLSLGQIDHFDLEGTIRSALDDSALCPQALTLEITETSLICDLELATASLSALTDIGIKIAIDDFGVGYSSLSYLEALPISSIKIDRSFIHGLRPESQKCEVVGAIVELAHTLGLRVVAEGVETERELALVRALHCDELQGHLLSPAEPPDRIMALRSAAPVLSVPA
jgi:diguanylate cyclase (GGDEF)-like protein